MAKKKEIYSPCISVCTIEEDTGFCRGCYRSLDEIAHWRQLSDEQRLKMRDELDKRRLLYKDMFSSPYST